METKHNTVPATEENLRLAQDATPFNPGGLSPPHAVIVDGIEGVASVGSHGAYSERIYVKLNQEHPDLGSEFGTKHFRIETPGIVTWGHEGKTFRILKIID